MANENMKKFTSPGLRNPNGGVGFLILGLMVLAGLMVNVGMAQTSFYSPQVLSGDFGTVTNDNSTVTADPGGPSTAGFPPNKPLWYQWTAPVDGEVELDTLGSTGVAVNLTFSGGFNPTNPFTFTTNNVNLDTVLAVYTGTGVTNLSQVAANDDLFPISLSTSPQFNISGSADYIGLPLLINNGLFFGVLIPPLYEDYTQPYYGPSGLRFNAKGGTTYYFAVDTKNLTTGTLSLNWAYQPSGVFRFATEDIDPTTQLPLYQTAETESEFPDGLTVDANSVYASYYTYNVPGVLVTVTRTAGSSGRVTVDYSTEDGTSLVSLPTNDVPAVAGIDYIPVSGRLVFDDFEMSKTILIPIGDSEFGSFFGFGGFGSGTFLNNTVFGLTLTNAQLDPLESGDVSPPRVDPTFNTAMVRILNVNADPYGPDVISMTVTNPMVTTDTNTMMTVTNFIVSTNLVTIQPTNTIFNFEKSNYRVPEDVNDGTVSPWTKVTIYVERFGTNNAAETLHYRINNTMLDDQDAGEEQNIYFPLQPGSDYAVPTPQTVGVVRGTNSDFNATEGTLSFPSSGSGALFQPITFTVTNSSLTKFNKDFRIQLYREKTVGGNTFPVLVGMVAETTVTILFNDQHPPAGSVDELYNTDFNRNLALPPAQIPVTTPQNNGNPGTSGQVNGLAVLTNNETVIVGQFASYNGFARDSIALADTNGALDTSFDPGSGIDNPIPPIYFINTVAVTPGNQIVIGGNFSSFDGSVAGNIARLNLNGSLDTGFNPGSGADGTVWAVAVQPDGKILIGGDFNHINGTPRNYLARLNTDGSLDTGFNPGTTFNGPVYALALSSSNTSKLMVGGDFAVAGHTYRDIARVNTAGGSLDASFNVGTGADNPVFALGWQQDGRVVVGGSFTHFNGSAFNRIVRLNTDGSMDTTNFFAGTGADDTVYSVTVQTNGTIYVGGAFASFNGTHRLGFTRLYSDGTVDTTFMDTAYNQFAGLKKIYSYDSPSVLASAVQSDGNVMIGGSFFQVGGGEADTNVCNTLDAELNSLNGGMGYLPASFADPNLWVEPKTRDGVRNRSNVARLIGGATPGPGNISLMANSYSANKSQSALSISMVRINGTLGPVSANFSVVPGLAQSGVDYSYNSTPPLYWIAWEYLFHPSRLHSDGLSGENLGLIDPYGLFLGNSDKIINNQSGVTVSIIDNKATSGNLNAQFQLANPTGPDQFYLGGESIPLGGALGASAASFTLIDDNKQSGTFGFSLPSYVATNTSVAISLIRTNGNYGTVSLKYSTTNGTAVVGTDYVGLTNGTATFLSGVFSTNFNVAIINTGLIYTNIVEKTVNLYLSSLSGPVDGIAAFGISNAVLRLVNPNYQGYLQLSATNYTGTVGSGFISFVVNRTSGSKGSISVQYATFDGTATNGVDYTGSTNRLSWNDGDVSSKTVNIPLLPIGTVNTTNKQFGVQLLNPTNGVTSAPSLLAGAITNATLTISNDNSFGTLQFSATNYIVNENGGYATITVTRTGGAIGMVSVNYATADGSAVSNANYAATSGVLHFLANQVSLSFTVGITNDGIVDPAPFYFNVSLSNPTNAILGSVTNATVRIVDVQSVNQPPGSPDTGFDSSTGMNGNVLALALQSNGQILAGGNFTQVGGTVENSIARLNADGSLDTAFLNGGAGANGAVLALVDQTDDRILMSGAFTSVNGVHRNYVSRLMTDGSLDTSFNPGSGADNTVNALAETFIGTNRVIYVGGAFGSFNSVSSHGLARLNNDGTVDTSFATGTGADGPVNAIAVYPTNSIYAGKVLFGGAFTHFNGVAFNNFARLNVDGSLDTNFNANLGLGANSAVHAITIQPDGRVLVGGGFTNFNGTVLNRIVRLNADGTLDTNFTANVGSGVSDTVEGIVLQPDNRIVVVGQFTLDNGVTRNRITRLLPNGAVDPTINFGDGANGDVDAVVIQSADGMLVIGGGFSQYDGQPAENIARIYGGSVTGSGDFTFTSANYQVNENGFVAAITIRRDGGTSGTNADGSGEVFVNFATVSGGTATNGVNYTGVSFPVGFPPGEVLETVAVPILQDHVITPNLTVNLALSNPTPPAGLGVQPNAVLTIINSDSAVSFSSSFYSQLKNVSSGVATIDIVRPFGTNGTCSVDFYTTTNGTAIAGTDYTPTNRTVTFNPGQSDIAVQVPVINNSLVEGNTTVGLLLTNAVGTTLSSPSNATLTIIDTVSASGQLSFSATNYVVNEGDGFAYLTVLRTNGSSGSVSVTFATIPGTAQPGVNYTAVTGPLTFANGETSKTIPVQLTQNNLVQGPVTFSVVLSNPTPAGAALIAPTNAIVTILSGNAGIAFVNATNYVSATNSFGTIFVQRIGSTNGIISADYFTTNGTALAGTNYTPVSGMLTFEAGETLEAVQVPLINDPLVAGNLTFGIGLSNIIGGQFIYPSNAVVILQAGHAGLSFTNSAASVLKSSGIAIIPVICSNTNVEPVSVNYFTANGSAVAGVNYTAAAGTLTFTNGQATNYFIVPIINNGIVDTNRSFTVNLSNPTPPGLLVAPSTQTVTIVEANNGFAFSSPAYTVLKSGIAANITVVRTGNTNTVATVNFIATNGTAIAGLDFIATNGTFVFTNGVISQTFAVTVINNTTVQPDKTVLLQLFNPSNSILVAPNAATLTIHDTSGSLVVPAGSALTHESFAPANGIIDPGENVTLLFAFRASGGTNVSNVSATLIATNGITSPSPASQNYGTLIVGGPSASQPFSFTASGTNSQQIAATFQLKSGASSIGTAIFTYTLGSWTSVYSNSAAIIINDFAPASPPYLAAPYPSIINVGGIGGTLIKATVILTNVSHTSPEDIDALVVGPGAQDTMIMAGAGGQNAMSHVTINFDDVATNSLPPSVGNGNNQISITNGTYKPTSYLNLNNTIFP
jgi:uncharacterized delta-60 repeat protein